MRFRWFFVIPDDVYYDDNDDDDEDEEERIGNIGLSNASILCEYSQCRRNKLAVVYLHGFKSVWVVGVVVAILYSAISRDPSDNYAPDIIEWNNDRTENGIQVFA